MEPEDQTTQSSATQSPPMVKAPVAPLPEPKSKIWLWIAGGVLLLGVGIVVGVFLGKQLYSKPALQPTPSAVAESTPTPNPTANWKTYTNNSLNYSIETPIDWNVDDGRFSDKGYVVIKPNNIQNYLLIISSQKNKVKSLSEWISLNGEPERNQHKFTFNGYEAILTKDTIVYQGDTLPTTTNHYYLINNNDGHSIHEVTSNKNYYSILNQILSTFRFVNPLSVVTPPSQPLLTKISGILSTTDWKLVSNNGVAFKIPNYANCDNDTQCATVTYTSYYQGTPSPLPAKITVFITDYHGGSRRQQYLDLDVNKSVAECKPLFVDSLFGGVNALQIPIDGGWCQGGYMGGIVSVVGSKLVVIGPSLTYNNNKEISRWDVRDTLVSTLKLQ